ncbi:MAG TPA: HDOD domain-containing protein [Kofleriaceae bacterium]
MRVLFVDDEPSILSGLRSLLHRQRSVWDMEFALGGEEALAYLEGGRFDVVVSDMRMPKIDGAQLLTIVQERWPATCRIVLSGHAEREAMLRVLPVMHVFLAKPCDPKTLRSAIERLLSVSAHTEDQALRSLIGRVDKLPTPPRLYQTLTKLANDPRASLDDIHRAIAADTAFAAKIMQIANSAAFGEENTTSLRQAVQLLGLELICAVALSVSIYAPTGITLPFSLERMQETSLRVAVLARQYVPAHLADVAFVSGLLHDVGRIVLALGLPNEYGALIKQCATSDEPIWQAERRMFGADHAKVGACLLQMWGLPSTIVDAVAKHHEPRGVTGELAQVVASVHVADALAGDDHPTPVDLEFLRECGLDRELEKWLEMASAA